MLKRALFPLLLSALLVPAALAKPVLREVTQFEEEPSQVIWTGKSAWISQQATDKILVWDQTQFNNLASLPACKPSNMLLMRNSQLMVACTSPARLLIINSVGQVVETFPRPREEWGLIKGAEGWGLDLSHITSMVQDSRGGTYIALAGSDAPVLESRGKGRIYYLNSSRTVLKSIVSKLDYPSALAISPDGKSLYVAEGLSRQIRRFSVQPGQLSNPQVLTKIASIYEPSAQAIADPWPNQLAFNTQGQLYVSLEGDGTILVLGQDGKRLGMLEFPVTNIKGFSFSRTDRVLYVTAINETAQGPLSYLYELRL